MVVPAALVGDHIEKLAAVVVEVVALVGKESGVAWVAEADLVASTPGLLVVDEVAESGEVHTRVQAPWAQAVVVDVVAASVEVRKKAQVPWEWAAVVDAEAESAEVHKMEQEPLVWAVVPDAVAASEEVRKKELVPWELAVAVDEVAASAEVHTMAQAPSELVPDLHPSPQCHCPRAAAETAAMAACNGNHPHADPCPDARHPHRPRRRQSMPPEARKGAARRDS